MYSSHTHCVLCLVFVGFYFYDRRNSLLLVIEPLLFIHFNICGRFWGIIGEFGWNRPERKMVEGSVVTHIVFTFLNL
jgi:hypothetical protein